MDLRLDSLPYRTPARVIAIDWAALSESDGRKLRNLGFDEGVKIEALHGAPLGGDPIAIRVGRMQVALRLEQARAISVAQDRAPAA